MKTGLRNYIAGLLLLGTTGAFAADIPECVNANPNSVDDVQRCIARLPGIAQYGPYHVGFSCQTLKIEIRNSQQSQPESSRRIPACRTIGDALMKQNGRYPSWYACTGYDGSQAQLNQCTKAFIQNVSQQQQLLTAECSQLKNGLSMLVSGNSDRDFDIRRNPPGCEAIATALTANGVRMTAAECLGYRANDPRHIQQCMQPTLDSVRSRIVKLPTCDESRAIYQQLLVVGNGKAPDGYAIPACSMIDPIVANILGSPAVAGAPAPQGNSPVQNMPAPSAIPSSPASATSYPAAQQYPATEQYPDYSSAGVSKEQQRAQRRQERMAEIQTGANVATQVLGTLGIGSAPTTNTGTATTSAQPAPEPVYTGTETESERKMREKQQKVNDAQQTLESVKGVLNMFGGAK